MSTEHDALPHDLAKAIQSGDIDALTRELEALAPGEAGWVLDRLEAGDREKLFSLISAERAGALLDDLADVQAIEVLEHLSANDSAAIVAELHSDTQVDLLGGMEAEQAEAVLSNMPTDAAEQARELLGYDEESAGGLMQVEFLQYRTTDTVQDMLEDLRTHADRYSDFDVQYAYVVDKQDRLRGVLPLRDILLAKANVPLADLMIASPLSVKHQLPLIDLRGIFDEKAYIGLPVTDEQEKMLGVVLRKSVYEATSEAVAEDFLKVAGLGKEELRSMPLRVRSRRRLSWLSVNILLNVLAASVIAFYQDTLAQVIALAVFLPIISDMSGCSGSQAVAVSIRELTLGLVRPTELLRVLAKEMAIGVVNGLALGLLLAIVALIWKGNPWLGLVVGGALMVNTMVAVCLGGSIPLVLKRFDLDPALASGPILTTVTDMCGFFLVLSLATVVLPKLV